MPTRSTSSWSYSVQECLDNAPVGLSHLLAIYGLAWESEIRDGIAWYPAAHDHAVRIHEWSGIDLVTVVKVACALSPRMPWPNNMPAAEFAVKWFLGGGFIPDIEEYAAGKVYLQPCKNADPSKPVLSKDPRMPKVPGGGLKSSLIKALWILQGHDWVLRGPKVNSFNDNVLNPLTSKLVTVDSHAIQAWFGSTEGGTYQIPKQFYAIIAADYIEAARRTGLSPLQFQAVVWLAKKRLGKGQ